MASFVTGLFLLLLEVILVLKGSLLVQSDL